LAAIVESAPLPFWREVKKRIIKSIFTHAVFNSIIENPAIKIDTFRLNAMKIAAKFQSISKLKDYDEYLKMIRNHFIKIMMEEKKEKFRLEAVKLVYLGFGTTATVDD